MEKIPKKIRITKVSQETYWYAKLIGMVVEVTGIYRGRYSTNYDNKRGLYTVHLEDCEIVEE